MANTNIKKNADGYGYKYTDLAEIHNALEAMGVRYYQYTETDAAGNDYIMTVPIIDGEEKPARRGCRIVQATLNGKTNPAQEQGSALTYARRYSLLMAFGLATVDDDAETLTRPKKAPQNGGMVEKVVAEANRTKTPIKAILDHYGAHSLQAMDPADLAEALERLCHA